MSVYTGANTQSEECLVAELEQLGVRFLSRLTNKKASHVRAPQKLLADLVQQPSSRVRAALIALLLAQHPYGEYVPSALKHLTAEKAQILKLFYTAAMLLQCQYATPLQTFLGADWH